MGDARVWEFPKPMIAQVHGFALGGGTYWAVLPEISDCGWRRVFPDAACGPAGYPGGETMIEPWVFMNFKRAAEYLYTAQTLSADEAFQMGLVNPVAPRARTRIRGRSLCGPNCPRAAVDTDGHQEHDRPRVGTDGHASASPVVRRRDVGARTHFRRTGAAGRTKAWATSVTASRRVAVTPKWPPPSR
jgi:enoyl-CoA hydratase/carnithine racemase